MTRSDLHTRHLRGTQARIHDLHTADPQSSRWLFTLRRESKKGHQSDGEADAACVADANLHTSLLSFHPIRWMLQGGRNLCTSALEHQIVTQRTHLPSRPSCIAASGVLTPQGLCPASMSNPWISSGGRKRTTPPPACSGHAQRTPHQGEPPVPCLSRAGLTASRSSLASLPPSAQRSGQAQDTQTTFLAVQRDSSHLHAQSCCDTLPCHALQMPAR